MSAPFPVEPAATGNAQTFDSTKPVKSKILMILAVSILGIGLCLAAIIFHVDSLPALTPALPGWSYDLADRTSGMPDGSEASIDSSAGMAIDGSHKRRSHGEILAELKQQQVMVTDTLSSHATFASGRKGTTGEWLVENVKSNQVIQQAELYLNNVCIARTAPLLPGQHVETVKLIREVPAGIQKVTAYLNYFNRDTHEFISRAGFNIKMTIGE